MIKVNINTVILEALNTDEVKAYIVNSNRSRLDNEGTDIEGVKLRTYAARGSNAYANYTIIKRESEGKQTGHVDLNDEGIFHNSIEALLKSGELIVIGDFDKSDGNIADNLDVSQVLGFTDKDIEHINELITPIIQQKLLQGYGIL